MGKYTLVFLLLFSSLFAFGKNFVDVGRGTMPLDPKKKCTSVKVGKRFESYKSGVDLSVSNRMTGSCQHYLSGQAIVTQDLNDNVYVGFGPGIGSLVEYKKGDWGTAQVATVEGVIGVKIPSSEKSPVTSHLEFGVTQPTYVFRNGTNHNLSRKPSMGLSLKLTY
ncbi:MAG: hypothetical protein S4CHLAM81_03510 [Chlamydiales bacterium]|nr:hypothetical protein [Chlamydiales bacterium]MCH9635141.1 hypothetical protein [Chlamydiales bacterium]MCH9703933.1 hypothetical protein [Chlamydiota bacterium]